MFNWLMDDNKCCVTRLEDYFRVNKEKLEKDLLKIN